MHKLAILDDKWLLLEIPGCVLLNKGFIKNLLIFIIHGINGFRKEMVSIAYSDVCVVMDFLPSQNFHFITAMTVAMNMI